MADYENDLQIKGLTRIQLYDYLFDEEDEKEKFINHCKVLGMDSARIRTYARKVRKKKIDDRNYTVERFVEKYKQDRIKALSELFMELVSSDKADLLTLNNPHEIFSIHSKCSKDIYFVKFVLAVRQL